MAKQTPNPLEGALNPLSTAFIENQKYSQLKAQCEAKGGKWDTASKTCIIPTKTETPAPAPAYYPTEGKAKGGANIVKGESGNVYLDTSGYQQNIQPLAPQPGGAAQAQQETSLAQQDVQQAQVDTFNQQKPQMRELSPQAEDSSIPVIGTIADIIQQVGGNEYLYPEGSFNKLTPERLRSDALTQIEKKVYDRGVDNNTKFGAIVEAIPIVGALVNQYARGLVDTPTGTVNDLRSQIIKKRKEITQLTKDAKLSPSIRLQSEENLNQIEGDIQKLESRIKLLINYSAQLKTSPEQVDLIEQDIYNTRRFLLSARIAIINNQTLASDEDILDSLTS